MESSLDGTETESGLKRCLIFGSSGIVRAGVQAILTTSPQIVVAGSTGSPAELATMVSATQVDVLVAAVSESDLSEISAFSETIPAVVVLANGSADQWISLGLRLEGFALLPSDASPDAIVSAVVAAASGLFVAPPDHLGMLVVRPASTASLDSREQLTSRELEVLNLIAEGIGNKTIAYRLGISDHTVKFHVASILRKLQAESRTEAVTEGIRNGLITV